MGEFADMAIEEGLAEEEWANAYCDDLYSEEDCPAAFIGFPPREITCRKCGESGLGWGKLNDKWRLYKDSELHVCKKHSQYDFIAGKWIKV